MQDWQIHVMVFKRSGKYYSDRTELLKPEHQNMGSLWLGELFRSNNEAVHYYSPVQNGFASDEFVFVINVEYPQKVIGFCTMMIDRKVLSF
jgi:hypothetical protein